MWIFVCAGRGCKLASFRIEEPSLGRKGCVEDLGVLFSRSVVSYSLQPHGLQCARLPHPSPSSGTCSNSCLLSRWCHPTVSSSVTPFSPFHLRGYSSSRVTKQDPMGPFWGQIFPHTLCYSSSLKCLGNSIWGTFLQLFWTSLAPNPMEVINVLMNLSTESQASCSLRLDNVNPSDTILVSHHQRTMHKVITDPVTAPPPHLASKSASRKPFRELKTVWDTSHPSPCVAPQ